MLTNIIEGIIAGVICAAITWSLGQVWNPLAKKEVILYAARIKEMLWSVNTDITWGAEDEKEIYYVVMIAKILNVLDCIDKIRISIRILNLVGCHKDLIMYQIDCLEREMLQILHNVICAAPDNEVVSRLRNFASTYQTLTNNILICRAEFITALIKTKNIQNSLNQVCIDDTEDGQERIQHALIDKKGNRKYDNVAI